LIAVLCVSLVSTGAYHLNAFTHHGVCDVVQARKLWQKEKQALAFEQESRVATVNPTVDDIDRGSIDPLGQGHQAFLYGKDSMGVAYAKGLAQSLHSLENGDGGAINSIAPEQALLLNEEVQKQKQVARYDATEKRKASKGDKGGSGNTLVVLTKPETYLPLWSYDGAKFVYLILVWIIMFGIVFIRGGGESGIASASSFVHACACACGCVLLYNGC
jgi:hypothetical protein